MINVDSKTRPINPQLVCFKIKSSICFTFIFLFKITNSIIRGAIPILSHKSAAVCLVLNCLLPGSGDINKQYKQINTQEPIMAHYHSPGTLVSGLLVLAFCRCSSQATVGCPRWHERSDSFDRWVIM